MNYRLPRGYQERTTTTQYIDKDDGVVWQIGAYQLGLRLCREHGLRSVVDVGCGGARKLQWFKNDDIVVVGYDSNHPTKETWLEQRQIDLDKGDVDDLLEGVAKPALVMCADVVEHLQYPIWLLHKLIGLALDGNIVIVTTPDRELSHGEHHLGPPPNPAHVREWTLAELSSLIDDLVPASQMHLFEQQASLTQTHDQSPNNHTITIVMRRK